MATESTISFPTIFNRITGRGQVSDGVRSINESLRSLLLTSRGELFGDPLFGCNIVRNVYDHNDKILNDILKKDIVDSIANYMSSLIKVTYDDISIINSGNKVEITIRYYINKSDSISTYKLVMLEGAEKDAK